MKLKKQDLIKLLQSNLKNYKEEWESANLRQDEFLMEHYEQMIYETNAYLKEVRFSKDTEFEFKEI